MDIFGIGPLEFLLILFIAFLILGPGDMAKAGRTIGGFLRKFVLSDEWRTLQRATREMREIPTKLMRDANDTISEIKRELPTPEDIVRDAGIDQLNKDLNEWGRDVSTWVTPPKEIESPPKPKADSGSTNNESGFVQTQPEAQPETNEQE
jgi:Sec-independent protein translocase protein TatA